MRPILPLLLVACLALPAAVSLDPVPVNDDRALAVPVAADLASVRVWEPTSGAGLETGEPRPCGDLGATVWFTVSPLMLSVVALDTRRSDYDTVLAVYAGAPSASTLLACNDDASSDAGPGVSELHFLAHPGETYYVQAGGSTGATGLLALHVQHWPPGP